MDNILDIPLAITNLLFKLGRIMAITALAYFQDIVRVAVMIAKTVGTGHAFYGHEFFWSDVWMTVFWAIASIIFLLRCIFPAVMWILTAKHSPKWFSPKRSVGFKVVGSYLVTICLMSLFCFARAFVDKLVG
jgi:hypothetical protein